MGLVQAGLTVDGVDIKPQPEYPLKMAVGNALEANLSNYDFVWASPPCQAFTAYKRRPGHVAPVDNLIPDVRAKLRAWGGPYVIENVVGAPLENPVKLCGSMFGLDVQRHRIFESNFRIEQPSCRHQEWTPRYPPATNRKNLRKTVEIGVWRIPLEVQRAAMGIGWMTIKTLSQAIPPAYSRYIAQHVLWPAL